MADELMEQSLLGCILLKPEIFHQVKASSEDFENPRNRKIYEAMGALDADSLSIEPVAIYERLMPKDRTVLKYMFDLKDNTGTSANYKHYDDRVREESVKGKAFILSNQILAMSKNGSSGHEILIKTQEMAKILAEKISGKKNLSVQIDEWLSDIKGTFFVTECDKELGIVTKRDKENRRQILNRLSTKGRIVKASNRQGHYRIVDDSLEVINFKEARADELFDIRWPFDIQKLVNILPKSIIIVAGAWEAGKTAFLLNVARMNMHKHYVRYMSSEMGDAEFALRLKLFTEMAPDDWNIEAIERSADWEDAIIPDGINIIDYLEQSDAFYNVGEKIRKIFDRLKKGVAIIALQKATGKDLGRGGDFTAEKARLYLSLDPGELTIVKGKLWANPQVSPKNMTMKFKLWQGHKFVPQGEWYKKIKQ